MDMRNAELRFKHKTHSSHRETAKLIGPVKQLMLCTYRPEVLRGQLGKGPIEVERSPIDHLNCIITYNEAGNKVADVQFAQDRVDRATYNDQGKLLTKEEIKEGRRTQFNENFYDEQGNHTGSRSVDGEGNLRFRIETTFNEQNLRTEHLMYQRSNEEVHERQVFTYDDGGNMLTMIVYDANGDMKRETINTYDAYGNRIESRSEHFDNMASLNRMEQSTYNEHNHCIQRLVYDLDGNLKETYNYSPQYDLEGNRTDLPTTPFWEEPVEGQTHEVKLDERGNWIERVTFFNKIPTSIEVREYVYFDEPDRELVHPLQAETAPETRLTVDPDEEMASEDARWVVEQWANLEQFPAQRYYAYRFKEIPAVVKMHGPNIEVLGVLKQLRESHSARLIHSNYNDWSGHKTLQRYVAELPYRPGYLVQATSIHYSDKGLYHTPEGIIDTFSEQVGISSLILYRPSEASAKRDPYFEDGLNDLILSCTLKKRAELPKINIVEVRGQQYQLIEHPVQDSFSIQDLDVNYGHGFKTFHVELMKRFNGSTKGLVLFHGVPGTGKTYYIRHLLKALATAHKPVIYMPPNMVDHLTDPVFMTFLTGELKTRAMGGDHCVLLIEDAEPLLAKRQEGVRIQGVTNLLNMTDGLLNDMMNIQIICTFNVDLKKLDSALLRPGRLVARKEFKPLSVLDANLLAQRLGIKHHFNDPATLGEIYAMLKDNQTLIHDVDQDKDSSTPLDDLL